MLPWAGCADWAEDASVGGWNGGACADVGKQGGAVARFQGRR